MKSLYVGSLMATLLIIPGTASAEDERKRPEVFTQVLDCRAIADDQQRVQCYDAAVAALATAEKSDDLLIASREDIQKEKRGLFGLTLPRIGLFSSRNGDEEKEEPITEITSVLKSASEGRQGYVFVLEDGSTWYQTDGTYINRPKPGESITVKRAALGSYMARVDGGLAVRVKRRQ